MSKRQLWNDRYASKELIWSAGPNELFASEVSSLQPGKALDVACGEGRNAIWLAEEGWDVTAIDFSDVGVNKGNQIAEKRGVSLTWIAEDVSTWNLTDEEYDLVAVLYLHTGEAERKLWLPNVLDAVKPSGTFIYIGHDPGNIDHGVGGPQDPALLPSVDEITHAMEAFQIEAAKVIERPVLDEPGHGKELKGIALDCLVRATKITRELE